MSEWASVRLFMPAENVAVEAMVPDGFTGRPKKRVLLRVGRRWFDRKKKKPVATNPTHWRAMP